RLYAPCKRRQALALLEKVRQGAGDDEAMPVLRQAEIAHLGEAEHALDLADRMLDPSPDPRIPPISDATARSALRGVSRVRRTDTQDAGLARIRRIAPDAPFGTLQQPRQDMTVMDVGRGHFDRVNELALAVDAEVALHAEVPLPPLLRLVHRW